MRRPISLIVVTAMLAGLSTGLGAQTGVRYDGIYQSQEQRASDGSLAWTYLRFTPDGMVVIFPTFGRPEQLGSFSLANLILPYASVTPRDGRISFTISTCDGMLVDYEGRAEGDRLYLRIHVNSEYRADEVFTFVPIPEERRRQWDNAPGWVRDPCGPLGTRGR